MAGSVPFFDYDADHKPLNYAFDDRHVLNFKIASKNSEYYVKQCTLDNNDITFVGIEYICQLLINKVGLCGRHVFGNVLRTPFDFTFPLTATNYTINNYRKELGELFLIIPFAVYAKEVKGETITSMDDLINVENEILFEYGPQTFDHFREILSSPFTNITGDAYAICSTYLPNGPKINIDAFMEGELAPISTEIPFSISQLM